jgi:hypothetical protein
VYPLQVNLTDLNDEVEVWSVFGESNETPSATLNCSEHVVLVPDPRLASLGCRLLLPRGLNGAYLKLIASQRGKLESVVESLRATPCAC